MYYTLGVLNYICKEKGIITTAKTGQWLTSKNRSKYDECINFFELNGKNDDEIACSVLAW